MFDLREGGGVGDLVIEVFLAVRVRTGVVVEARDLHSPIHGDDEAGGDEVAAAGPSTERLQRVVVQLAVADIVGHTLLFFGGERTPDVVGGHEHGVVEVPGLASVLVRHPVEGVEVLTERLGGDLDGRAGPGLGCGHGGWPPRARWK